MGKGWWEGVREPGGLPGRPAPARKTASRLRTAHFTGGGGKGWWEGVREPGGLPGRPAPARKTAKSAKDSTFYWRRWEGWWEGVREPGGLPDAPLLPGRLLSRLRTAHFTGGGGEGWWEGVREPVASRTPRSCQEDCKSAKDSTFYWRRWGRVVGGRPGTLLKCLQNRLKTCAEVRQNFDIF